MSDPETGQKGNGEFWFPQEWSEYIQKGITLISYFNGAMQKSVYVPYTADWVWPDNIHFRKNMGDTTDVHRALYMYKPLVGNSIDVPHDPIVNIPSIVIVGVSIKTGVKLTTKIEDVVFIQQ